MAENLCVKMGGGVSAEKNDFLNLGLIRIGEFSETSPKDAAHVALMTNGGTGWSECFDYSNGTYTCKKKGNYLVAGWVNHFSASSYTLGQGELYVNGVRRCSYQVRGKGAGNDSNHFGVLHKFSVGDTFYFRTPSDNGYPKQWGELFFLTDSEYKNYAAKISGTTTVAVDGATRYLFNVTTTVV